MEYALRKALADIEELDKRLKATGRELSDLRKKVEETDSTLKKITNELTSKK